MCASVSAKPEDNLRASLRRLFPSPDKDKVRLLRAILDVERITRRQLMKKTKIERNRTYKLTQELEESECIRVVEYQQSIKGKRKLYDLTFKGALILLAYDPAVFSKLPDKIRTLIALPIAIIDHARGPMEFSPHSIIAMLLVWAQYWRDQPFAPMLIDNIAGLERYVVPQFWATMMEMAFQARTKSIPVLQRLRAIGLTEEYVAQLQPLLQRQLVREKENQKIIETELLTPPAAKA